MEEECLRVVKLYTDSQISAQMRRFEEQQCGRRKRKAAPLYRGLAWGLCMIGDDQKTPDHVRQSEFVGRRFRSLTRYCH